MCIYIYIYIYIERERDRRAAGPAGGTPVAEGRSGRHTHFTIHYTDRCRMNKHSSCSS